MRELKPWALRLVVLCVVALSSSSCASSLARKISIDGYENLRIRGFSGVTTDVVFSNKSCYNIHVKAVDVDLKRDDDKVLTLSLKDEIVIPRRSERVAVPTVWRLGDLDPLKAFSLSKKLLKGEDVESMSVDIEAQAKVGPIKKTVRRNGLKVSSLLSRLKR